MDEAGTPSLRHADDRGTPSLSDLLRRALEALAQRASGGVESYRDLIEIEIPNALHSFVPAEYQIRGRTGIGDVADVPWVGIFAGPEASAKRGLYLVFLFAYDGSRVYLSMNQGTERVKGGTGALEKRALDLRSALPGNDDLAIDLDLRSENQRPKRYAAASAYAMTFEAAAIPDDEELRVRLDRMLALLRRAVDSGINFDPEVEPTHVVMKWKAELKPTTVVEHKKIADERGSVWWGKFGNPATRSISDSRLEHLRSQISAAVETFCFLYRKGELWRTRLEDITTNPSDVDIELLPGYYQTSDCNLFLRLSSFESLTPEWAAEHLVMTSNPDPDAMRGALGNQTSPVFVYERFDPGAKEEKAVAAEAGGDERSPLTLEWLENETLLDRDVLEEMVNALDARGQIVLAGPPGTSKTWVARALARYVTEDAALAYRVVQFHPSYGYEEFIEGLRPVAEGNAVSFKREDGVVLKLASEIDSDDDQKYVLVLDEMNRANLPRVFGELMYLLEYRGESIDLMYTEDFVLPEKLLFIGTMNTADRSIRSIDIALRRRFDVFECPPDRAILERFYSSARLEVADLLEGFESLNSRLTELLDRHNTIGHSFFMADPMTPSRLRRTWQRQLLPLIEELLYDQPDVVAEFQLGRFWPSAAHTE